MVAFRIKFLPFLWEHCTATTVALPFILCYAQIFSLSRVEVQASFVQGCRSAWFVDNFTNNHVTPHVTHNWSKVRTPNDVMSGITRGKLRFWVGLSDDLQDIALHTDREERQLKAKPVELASYETIGDDSDHLRAQKRQFFGAKLLYKPLPSIILCCRLFVNFLTTNTLVQYRSFQTLHIRRSVARKYSFVCGYMKDHKIVFPPSLPSCLKVTRRKSKIASA